MTLQPPTRIGAYEILSPLGAGGMGEVYRARDSRLGRDVAIKILPERWLRDPERRARFDREARVLASLNHPHIGAIYGVEESDGVRALVLELIAGPTLADWLKDGPLAVRDALRIAVQIAGALEAAHERNIVHRDLKPANVILRGARRSMVARPSSGPRKRDSGPGGELTVKVVDFGLAKELHATEAGADFTGSPTMALDATREGVLIGTVGYMSPEQARGESVDKRTDLWAFGCVLYEMLSGCAPFGGATLPDTLAAIVAKDPDWSALPSDTPAEVRRVLRRCLEKDWHERLRDAGDARLAIEDADEQPDQRATLAPPSLPAPERWRGAAIIALAALMLGVIAGWLVSRWPGGKDQVETAPAAEMRLEISTPPTYDPASLAISPDGRKLAFVASSDGRSLLWVRPLDNTSARPLAGTDGASLPFWSPDGRELAFFADRKLKRIDVELGAVQVLAAAEGGRGGVWLPDGSIVFQPSPRAVPMVRIPASGGSPLPFEAHTGRFPQLLPDGRHLIFFHYGTPQTIKVAALDGSGARSLLETDSGAVHGAGHLLFVRGTTVLAQKFDLAALAVSADAFPIARDVRITPDLRSAPLSASGSGTIVFREGTVTGLRQLAWVDRKGRTIATVGPPISSPNSLSLAPDETAVAFNQTTGGNIDIWRLDTVRGVLDRLSTEPGPDLAPVWSADGTRIAYGASEGLVVRATNGGGEAELILPVAESWSPLLAPADWSRDGRFLLFSGRSAVTVLHGAEVRRESTVTEEDVWVLPLDPPGEPFLFAGSDFTEVESQFSPDGKWISYTSDESGRPEVYISRFDGPVTKQSVSSNGGGMARWRDDGRELFYVTLDGRLMAVPLEVSPDGASIRALAPLPLFDARVGPPMSIPTRHQYMVARDGQRFLMSTIAEQEAPPITVLLNWQP